MKFQTPTSKVEHSGALAAPTQFSISASKEAFRVLSSGLYNNKIRAIIRELSCNAYDAHVAAGRPNKAFQIHLPNTMEPYFKIRDKGTGLEYIPGGCKPCKGTGLVEKPGEEYDGQLFTCSTCDGTGAYDAVKELYCTYFATNKSDSNLFIGALGLGSKSPFCYTEGFSVVNTYNGTARIYSCFINEEGLPTSLLQSEHPVQPGTHNGLEVSFPVRQKDCWAFENQAKVALEFFEPRPKLNVHIDIQRAEYSRRGKRWGLRKNLGHLPRAIQGRVQYDLGDIDQSRLTPEQTKLLELPLDLFFEIGQLSVAASREALSNDEATIQNILTLLDQVKEELMVEILEQVARTRTPWEARNSLFTLATDSLVGWFVHRAELEGRFETVNPHFVLSKTSNVIQQDIVPNCHIVSYEWKHNSTQARRNPRTAPYPEDGSPREDKPIKFDPVPTVFVINDVGFGAERYVHFLRQKVLSSNGTRLYFITTGKRNTPVDAVVREGKRAIAVLGNPPVKYVSEIREEYRAQLQPVKSDSVPTRELLIFNPAAKITENTLGWIASWENAAGKTIPEGAKYYLPLKSLVPQTGNYGDAAGLSSFLAKVRRSRHWSFKDEPLYGIPSWRVDKLGPNWREFTGYVMGQVKRVLTPEVSTQLALRSDTFSSGIEDALARFAKNGALPSDSKLKTFCVLYTSLKANANQLDVLKGILSKAQSLGLYDPDKQPAVRSLRDRWKEIVEQYPLLAYLRGSGEELEQCILQYIRFMDEEARVDAEVKALFQVPSQITVLASQEQTTNGNEAHS